MQNTGSSIEETPKIKIDLRVEGVPQDAILKDEDEKLEKLKSGSCTKSIREDLKKSKMIFSEEPSRVMYEMGKMELFKLKQISVTTQCAPTMSGP